MLDHVSDVVDVTLRDESRITLVISQATPRVVDEAQFRTELPGAGEVVVAWRWLGWKRHLELGAIPSRHTVTIAGVPFQEVTYKTYGGSVDRPSILSEAPAMSAPNESPRAAPGPFFPATGEVAPGVHVLDVSGFVVMFVEFRDFVVAMEAPAVHPGFEGIPARPGSTQVTADFLAAIAKAVPAKPIRYVVLSHHHSDHIGGAGLFARAGATILVAPEHRAAVTKAVEATGGTARIETVAKQRTITDGSRTLEILNTGRNPHTTENLAVWLPEQRIIFQGDLFYYSEGEVFPPSGRATMNRFFAEWLRKLGMQPVAVYGVHNTGAAGAALLELARAPR